MSGRAESVRSKAARARKARAYTAGRWAGVPGDFEFRFSLLRGRGVEPLALGESVETVEWVDEAAVLQGTLSLHRAIPDDPRSLPIGRGHQVRCLARQRGSSRWEEQWTMRVLSPDVDPGSGTVTAEVLDDLDIARRNERDWSFRTSKARPRGWLVHDAAFEVCRQEGIPVRVLAEGTARITRLRRRDANALDMLRAIYSHEREVSGRRFVIRWVRGAMEVRPYERNRLLYAFEDQITQALLSQEASARPVTVIVGRGRVGRGKDAKTVRHVEAHPDVIRRFGRAVARRDYGRVDSEADLRRKVRREYAWAIRIRASATLTVPGIPDLRRGMGCELLLPAEGYGGTAAFVFITRVTHRVDAGGFVSELEVNRVDPFVRDRKRRESDLRAIKRRERARRRRAAA